MDQPDRRTAGSFPPQGAENPVWNRLAPHRRSRLIAILSLMAEGEASQAGKDAGEKGAAHECSSRSNDRAPVPLLQGLG
jgi:hypothetical protein